MEVKIYWNISIQDSGVCIVYQSMISAFIVYIRKGNIKIMRKYKIASFLMIVHGGFMELGGALCFICAILFGQDNFDIGKYISETPY